MGVIYANIGVTSVKIIQSYTRNSHYLPQHDFTKNPDMLKSVFVLIEFYSYRNLQPLDFGRRVVCLHCSFFTNTLFASKTRALAPI
jgi:hypothetical protein